MFSQWSLQEVLGQHKVRVPDFHARHLFQQSKPEPLLNEAVAAKFVRFLDILNVHGYAHNWPGFKVVSKIYPLHNKAVLRLIVRRGKFMVRGGATSSPIVSTYSY